MQKVILDTSSLIELAIAARYKENVPKVRPIDLYYSFGGIDQVIEALILYDQISVDSPSIRRNSELLPDLEQYSSWCKHIAVEEGMEQRIYESVLEECVPHIEITTDTFDPFRMHTQEWMTAEVGIGIWCPSATWKGIESELTDRAKDVARTMRQRFEGKIPYAGAALLQLLRTMYYDRLQQIYRMDLVLHPLKHAFRQRDFRPGFNILKMFDSSVRKAFEDRKRTWLGRDDPSAEIPMLTSYVLNKCKHWGDLPKVIKETRESKSASKFRVGLNRLSEAASNHDNETVDTILADLSAATKEWSKELGITGLKRKITLTVPVIGLSTEFEVPDKMLSKSPAEQLLVFIHEVLVGA